MVQIGSISDRDGAAAIAKELSVGGFSQTKVTMQAGFRVVSEPLPGSVADGLVATLAGRGIHSQVEPLGVCPRNTSRCIMMHVPPQECAISIKIFMFAHDHSPFSISRTHS
jgi:hypothetical protein